MSMLFSLGPIGLASGDYLQTHDSNGNGFRRLWWRVMYRSNSTGVKMSKPDDEDIENIRSLITVSGEEFSKFQDGKISAEHLLDTIYQALDKAERSQGRVLFGMEVILDPRNNIFDPNTNYFDLSPEIKEGLWLRSKVSWLFWLLRVIRFQPWHW
jgi:hypothetical protein